MPILPPSAQTQAQAQAQAQEGEEEGASLPRSSETLENLERLRAHPPDALKDTQLDHHNPGLGLSLSTPLPHQLRPMRTEEEADAVRAARVAQGLNRKSPWPARSTTLRKVIQASQAELGSMIGVSRSLISGIEHGTRVPGLATQHKLAEIALRAGLLVNVFQWLPNTIETKAGALREDSPLYEQRLYNSELDSAVWAVRVKRLRFACQMNTRQFAQTLGVSRGAVIAWENGINTPTTITKQRLETIRDMQGFDWNLGHTANIFMIVMKYMHNYCYDLKSEIEHVTGRGWGYFELWANGNYLDNDMTLLSEEEMTSLLNTFNNLLLHRKSRPVREDILTAVKPGEPGYQEPERKAARSFRLTDEERTRISRELDDALASDNAMNTQQAMDVATTSEREMRADRIADRKNFHMLEDVEHDYMTGLPGLPAAPSAEAPGDESPAVNAEASSSHEDNEPVFKPRKMPQVKGTDSPQNVPDVKGFDSFLDSLQEEDASREEDAQDDSSQRELASQDNSRDSQDSQEN